MSLFGWKIGARLLGMLATIALVVALLLWGPAACRSYFTAKKQAEVSKGQADAAINSGAEATNTLGNIIESGRQTDEAVKEGSDAIRSAPEGERGDAAVRAACRLRAYQHLERCAQLRAADSARAEGARPRD